MKRWLPVILDTVFALSWGVWLGGLVMLWLADLPPVSQVATLRRWSGVVEFCGIALIAVQFLTRRRYQRVRTLFVADGARQLLTFGALLLAELARYNLLPVMESVQTGKPADFTRLRIMFGTLAFGQAALLVAIGGLTAWLQQLRVSGPAAVGPSATTTPPEAKP